MRGAWIVAFLAVAAVLLAGAGLRAQEAQHEKYVSPWKTPWDYAGARGAEHWSELDPAYAPCNEGKEQSPVDIRDTEKAELTRLRFESKTGLLKYVINNGHTIRVNYLRGNGNFLWADGQRYESHSFTFTAPARNLSPAKRIRWKCT